MKKIEEASNEKYIELIDNKRNGVVDLNKIIIDSFKAGVEFAQRWISVNEEMPTVNRILIKTKEGHVFSGHCFNGYFSTDTCYGTKYEITHWRPIEYK